MIDIVTKIQHVDTQESALDEISSLMSYPKVNVVSFINAHAYNMADNSDAFKHSLLNSDVLFRDGVGAKILLKAYNKPAGYNANGTDLIPIILNAFKNNNICFIGTESPYIEQATAICRDKGINVVDYLDGFQTTQKMSEFVEHHQPRILILGMGMPKQEAFSMFLKSNYASPLLIINGGAIFDFMANRFDRAPTFFRNNGLEWLYRLTNEPKRLFKRYVLGIPIFIMKLLKHKAAE
ncbi:WecB/TagA/CpsF family glycosyltransferase [Glaciecola sp. SC05]|uniref:WecB/TagA/CpsF family glycosyltransferase n=1 Tax=Glaciecola sp. SC05 TaxID=1987355 RepID=UPI0035281278